ncbi:unnamed protein product [Ceutorhynchus assimilis]|uniref:J domain-containing protein n=1 Tax=Ceutorhynchus assimilis TaxID=467358 RepID=A0A9N9QQN1_9CUCU|nr:unnamed protein product [Ceutorhynchus assimilis]
MNYKLTMFVLSQIRKLSTSRLSQQHKNHYDSLGIAKSATQGDVKTAYYKLSKVYHPDRNQGTTFEQREQHSQKFRDISEAYEILGNVRSRKMYDKGFLGGNIFGPKVAESTPDDPLAKFYKSREHRARPPNPTGQQPIYDFDEWSRQHYGASVRRDRELKEKRAAYAAEKKAKEENKYEEFSVLTLLVIIFTCLVIQQYAEGFAYDRPKKGKYSMDNEDVNRND